MISFEELIKSGVHFGHITSRCHPKMKRFIWGQKNNVNLIDISMTAFMLKKAGLFLSDLAAQKKTILWVGTKKAARDIVQAQAEKLNMPFVCHRWIGGTLSNHSQVKKSVTKLLHYEDIVSKSEKFPHYTKKELNVFQKMVERLRKNIGGIRKLSWPIGAIVTVDALKESSAIKEAVSMGIPVVSLVDTNTNPALIDYVIPGNDDAPRSIKLVIEYLGNAVAEGQKKAIEADKKAKEAAQLKADLAAKAKKAEKEAKATDVAEKPAKKEAKASAAKKKTPVKKADTKTSAAKTSTKATKPKAEKTAEAKKAEPKKTAKKSTAKKTETKAETKK